MDIIKYLEGRQEYLGALARKEQMVENDGMSERLARTRLSEVSMLLYVLKEPERGE